MISTVAMIRLGYVHGNRMTNMKSSNIKLKDRGLRILMAETGLSEIGAADLLEKADDDLRVALVMFNGKAGRTEAESALSDTAFVVEAAVAKIKEPDS